MKLEFERDASRAEGNLAKHGVAFEEAVSVFAGPVAASFDDPAPPDEESREILVGLSMRRVRESVEVLQDQRLQTAGLHAGWRADPASRSTGSPWFAPTC